MALRSAAALAAAPRGFFRLCSTSSSTLPFLSSQAAASTPAREQAEPNTNLFVSGKTRNCHIKLAVMAFSFDFVADLFSGLSKRTTSEGLREAFAKFGEVVHAKVVTDRVSGYSKGFGFVRYSSLEDAANGIKGMDGSYLDGWVIFAEYAKPRPPPTTPGNNTNMGPASNGYRWQ
ncbi:hypothetical protein Tsubulata_030916 [Turnera subulata]|uniref:RRM domain-containing protein n=1 Tax=Turnera subulata TaxID=218843 RepID=A0A9Q0GDW1_9ROSI|nr:hypothetical protein Tsubulata_030916 [Turnera subulata]